MTTTEQEAREQELVERVVRSFGQSPDPRLKSLLAVHDGRGGGGGRGWDEKSRKPDNPFSSHRVMTMFVCTTKHAPW